MRSIKFFYFYIICIFIFPSYAFCLMADNPSVISNPDNYISVEFENAPLSEIVILVAEKTGVSFIVQTESEKYLTWVEPNLDKTELLASFRHAVLSAGFTIHLVPSSNNLFVIRQKSTSIPHSLLSSSYYFLKNIQPEVLEDTAEILYGDTLSINPLKDTNVILIAGSFDLISEFTELLQKIDVPQDTDISVFRLKNISVKSGIKALTDISLLGENGFYPDYWNRSIIIKGTPYQRNVASAVLLAIDKPQDGWFDQVEFIQSVPPDTVIDVVGSACPGVEIRKIGDNRILVSGNESDVNKASALVHKIDGTGVQVKIEAVIAYLTDREYLDIGGRLQFQDSHNKYAVNDGLISSLTTGNTGILVDFFRNFGLTFAAEDGNAHGRIISSPVLTVLNGHQASIHVGQNVPYISKVNKNNNNGSETATSVERKDLGISFTVNPLVDPSGRFVHLTVRQEVSSLASETENSAEAVDVIFDTNELSSTVRIVDGGTIFLGGLRSESQANALTRVPFLSSIPGLGRLFSYKSKHNDSRHLVVSLRVNVLDGKIL